MNNFWKRKKVLVTGSTGFKGSWLCIWLLKLGADVIGYSLDPYTDKDNFVLSNLNKDIVDIRGDIRDFNTLKNVFEKYQPEIVFHLAAQPLVGYSYLNPTETYNINVMGTINVLECIREAKNNISGIFITTDKCYENTEQIWGYREKDPLGGYDPYSSSKAAAEIAINSWKQSYFNPLEFKKTGKVIASVRAGNVIGGGDWATNRIIPDCIRSLESNIPIEIRSPESIRPWEHVLEPLSGYLLLAEKISTDPEKFSGSWNFGPDSDSIITVWELSEFLISNYGSGLLIDTSNKKSFHEAHLLSLDITKARIELGWRPTMDIQETVKLTVDWYKRYNNGAVKDLCIEQITAFENMRVVNGCN